MRKNNFTYAWNSKYSSWKVYEIDFLQRIPQLRICVEEVDVFFRRIKKKLHDENVLKCKLFGKLKMMLNQLCNTRSNVQYTITTDQIVPVFSSAKREFSIRYSTFEFMFRER